MNNTNTLYLEYERLYKEMETAYNIWVAYDENDPFSEEALKAFKVWERASNRRKEAFDAWIKALKQNTT